MAEHYWCHKVVRNVSTNDTTSLLAYLFTGTVCPGTVTDFLRFFISHIIIFPLAEQDVSCTSNVSCTMVNPAQGQGQHTLDIAPVHARYQREESQGAIMQSITLAVDLSHAPPLYREVDIPRSRSNEGSQDLAEEERSMARLGIEWGDARSISPPPPYSALQNLGHGDTGHGSTGTEVMVEMESDVHAENDLVQVVNIVSHMENSRSHTGVGQSWDTVEQGGNDAEQMDHVEHSATHGPQLGNNVLEMENNGIQIERNNLQTESNVQNQSGPSGVTENDSTSTHHDENMAVTTETSQEPPDHVHSDIVSNAARPNDCAHHIAVHMMQNNDAENVVSSQVCPSSSCGRENMTDVVTTVVSCV